MAKPKLLKVEEIGDGAGGAFLLTFEITELTTVTIADEGAPFPRRIRVPKTMEVTERHEYGSPGERNRALAVIAAYQRQSGGC
jgi:hypothetical protein